MINIAELQRLARLATPGPWEANKEGFIWCVDPDLSQQVAAFVDDNDAPYIAACSPERILALTEAVENAELLVAQVRKSVAEWHADSTPMVDLAKALTIYDRAASDEIT